MEWKYTISLGLGRSSQSRSPTEGDLSTGKCKDQGKAISVDSDPSPQPTLPPVYCCLSEFEPPLLDLKECLLESVTISLSPPLLQVIWLLKKLEHSS